MYSVYVFFVRPELGKKRWYVPAIIVETNQLLRAAARAATEFHRKTRVPRRTLPVTVVYDYSSTTVGQTCRTRLMK